MVVDWSLCISGVAIVIVVSLVPKKYQCKAVKCHLFTWGIISFCNFPLSEKSGYLCIARTGDMESSND